MRPTWIALLLACAACGAADYRQPYVGTYTGSNTVTLGGAYTTSGQPAYIAPALNVTITTLNTQELSLSGFTCGSLTGIATSATTFTLESANCQVISNGCTYWFFYDAGGSGPTSSGGTLAGKSLSYNASGSFDWNCGTGATGTDGTFTESATLTQVGPAPH
jgi:hypothetical protein